MFLPSKFTSPTHMLPRAAGIPELSKTEEEK